jgi:kumamolisin
MHDRGKNENVTDRTTLNGWEHSPLKGAKPTTPHHPNPQMQVTVLLRPQKEIPHLHTSGSPLRKDGKHPSSEEFAQHYGSSTSDIAKIHTFATHHNLAVSAHTPHHRAVVFTGAAKDIAQAFATDFAHFHHERASYFSPTTPPSVPAELKDIVQAVLGLHTRPSATRHRFWAEPESQRHVADLADIYAFPKDTDGTGQTIALIELGGGYNPADIQQYCAQAGIPTPHITSVNVQSGKNQPAHPHDVRDLLQFANGQLKLSAQAQSSAAIEAAQSTVEVTMDIEIVAALAPGARIVVYFATLDEQGIYHALARAIHDTQHRPDIISISWGEPETGLSDAYIRAIDHELLVASHLGITVFASSGDAGALNNSPDHLPAVNFPASSPHCLACGGTTPESREQIVWNATHFGLKGATGGGVSRKFPVPAWQQHADVPLGPTGKPGRGVPDVAGPADPRYGAQILVGGYTASAAGTSAVAPLWAALIARCNQALGSRSGHLNSHLYDLAHKGLPIFKHVTKGHNDVYHARPGWDPCTGHGTPHGEHLLHHLKATR